MSYFVMFTKLGANLIPKFVILTNCRIFLSQFNTFTPCLNGCLKLTVES